MHMTPRLKENKSVVALSKLNHSLKLVLFFAGLSLLSACSLFSQDMSSERGDTPVQFIPLLPVPSELQQKVWLEKFTFSLADYGSNKNASTALANNVTDYAKQSMLLQTEFSNDGINIAAMSFDGIPLAQASWQSNGQTVKSELSVAKSFDAKQVLHDLQIVHWPISVIAPALMKGFSVDERVMLDGSDGNKIKIRRYHHQGEVIITIRYQVGNIIFEQLTAGYRLTITRLTDSKLKTVSKP